MRPVAIDVLTSIYGMQPSASGPNVKATSRKYWRYFDGSVQRKVLPRQVLCGSKWRWLRAKRVSYF